MMSSLFPFINKKQCIKCIVFLLLSASGSAFSGTEEQSKGGLKEQELKLLRQDIKALKNKLKAQQSEKSLLEKEIRNAEQLIADNAKQIFVIQKDIEVLDAQLLDFNKTLDQYNQKLTRQQQLLSGQLQASYAIGRQETLKLLLNQQDPATISRVLTYYDYFNKARSEQIGKVNVLLKKVMNNKQAISLTRQNLNDKHHVLRQEKHQLQEIQTHRNELVAQLKLDIVSQDKKLISLLENKKNLTQLVSQLKEAMEDISNIAIEQSFKKQKGRLYWPAKGKVKQLFGDWRSTGKVKWQGNIIEAKEGDPVYSIYYGRIAYADWLRGYGLIIIVDHGDGYMSLYGHNQTLLKEVGDWVKNNEIIATVGSSGGLQQVGLYFEIRYNGRPTNPARWCQ